MSDNKNLTSNLKKVITNVQESVALANYKRRSNRIIPVNYFSALSIFIFYNVSLTTVNSYLACTHSFFKTFWIFLVITLIRNNN
jgi:hypothetical protein